MEQQIQLHVFYLQRVEYREYCEVQEFADNHESEREIQQKVSTNTVIEVVYTNFLKTTTQHYTEFG